MTYAELLATSQARRAVQVRFAVYLAHKRVAPQITNLQAVVLHREQQGR